MAKLKSNKMYKEQTVNIAELKAKLSSYLKLVQSGKPIVILDRNLPIAKISSYRGLPGEDHDFLQTIPPQNPDTHLKNIRGKRLKVKTDIVSLLMQDRDEE